MYWKSQKGEDQRQLHKNIDIKSKSVGTKMALSWTYTKRKHMNTKGKKKQGLKLEIA